MTIVPASPTLAYLIPGGAFASGQGYYVDRSPRGLLRQLVHRDALCRTGVSWLQPPHPTPNPEAAVRPARGPCGQAMLSRWPPEHQAERKTFNPSMPVQKGSDTVGEFAGLAESSTYAGKSARIVASIRTETGFLSFLANHNAKYKRLLPRYCDFANGVRSLLNRRPRRERIPDKLGATANANPAYVA